MFSDEDRYIGGSSRSKIFIQEKKIIALGVSLFPVEHFPFIVKNFPDLAQLSIINGYFNTIPPIIVKLSNLKMLDLHNNHIRTVPDFICQLNHLIELDLSDNEIAGLPDNIGTMTQLARLLVDRNQITLLPSSLFLCTSLQRINVSDNPLVSLAGIPPSLSISDIALLGATEALTFKGCILAQLHSIDLAVRMDYEYNRLNNRAPYFSYNGPLYELPIDHIPKFVEILFAESENGNEPEPETNNLLFPRLPTPVSQDLLHHIYYGPILPEFRAFLISFLKHISDYNENSWKKYYARHPIDLARSYIKTRRLTLDERERLVHECDYRIFNFLKENLAVLDPLLQDLQGKFSIEMKNQSLCL
ncbi:MAG: leucine-rich repeat domain-containing protein [Promethearchaeota archaeon]